MWQGLPASFVTPWDNWLQEQMLALREARPDDWLDTYLCRPMWRFVIRDDELGPETWSGIILPSVDVVGRYFPFTIATALPRYAPLVPAVRLMAPWLSQAEDIALLALSETLSVDEVLARLRELPTPEVGERQRAQEPASGSIWKGQAAAGDDWAEDLLFELIGHSFEQPCHWSHVDGESGTCSYLLSDGFRRFDQLFTA